MNGNENLDNWDGFLGSNFLKAKDVNPTDVFVVVGTEFDEDNDRPILLLEGTGKKSKFSLNVTNSNYLKNNKITSHKACIGKKITFNQEPTSKGLGLRIKSIE